MKVKIYVKKPYTKANGFSHKKNEIAKNRQKQKNHGFNLAIQMIGLLFAIPGTFEIVDAIYKLDTKGFPPANAKLTLAVILVVLIMAFGSGKRSIKGNREKQ